MTCERCHVEPELAGRCICDDCDRHLCGRCAVCVQDEKRDLDGAPITVTVVRCVECFNVHVQKIREASTL